MFYDAKRATHEPVPLTRLSVSGDRLAADAPTVADARRLACAAARVAGVSGQRPRAGWRSAARAPAGDFRLAGHDGDAHHRPNRHRRGASADINRGGGCRGPRAARAARVRPRVVRRGGAQRPRVPRVRRLSARGVLLRGARCPSVAGGHNKTCERRGARGEQPSGMQPPLGQ